MLLEYKTTSRRTKMHWDNIKDSIHEAFDCVKLVVGATMVTISLVISVAFAILLTFLLFHPAGWMILALMAAKVLFG